VPQKVIENTFSNMFKLTKKILNLLCFNDFDTVIKIFTFLFHIKNRNVSYSHS